jgi:hypothetical protein
MITIPLSTEDLTKVRLAPSPLWETVTSFGVLLHQGQGRDTVHAPWANRARSVLPGTDLSALVADLSRLKAAELVEPHRSGKKVYYRLSGPGESLLGIFGETS